MKNSIIISVGILLGSALLVMGQSAPAPTSQNMGRGRGGAPFAWNDRNKDGVCDLTGQAVGAVRSHKAMRGGRRGWGGAAMGRGFGAGFQGRQQQTPPAPAPK